MTRVKHVLLTLWVLPVAIPIWCLYLWPATWFGLLRRERRYTVETSNDLPVVEFYVNNGPSWWTSLWQGWAGHAMPGATVLDAWHEQTYLHEARHVRQWYVFGVFFPVLYLLGLVGFGYPDHPFENDANAGVQR